MTVTFLIKTQNDLIVITSYQHLLYHTVLVTQFLRLFYFCLYLCILQSWLA